MPQQGLTRVAIHGFDDLSHTTQWFTQAQQNVMAGDGVWIVTQDTSGRVFTRDALTTGNPDDLNQCKEMITRNVDSISYYIFQQLDPYIGVSNVTTSLLALLRAELKAAIMFLKSSNYVAKLGPQLTDAAITALLPSPTLGNRIICELSLAVPMATDDIECHLIV